MSIKILDELLEDITKVVIQQQANSAKILNEIEDQLEKENIHFLRQDKHIVESLKGALFLVKGNKISTPSIDQGCRKTVYRKQEVASIGGYVQEYRVDVNLPIFMYVICVRKTKMSLLFAGVTSME